MSDGAIKTILNINSRNGCYPLGEYLMFPWMIYWAPQIYFPASGDVVQRIAPNTNWFSDHINPDAGDPETEEAIFNIASYGTQLGILNDIVQDLTEHGEVRSQNGKMALTQLQKITKEISDIKRNKNNEAIDKIIIDINTLKQKDQEKFNELKDHLSDLIKSDTD